jgi:hypothetical protein
VPLKGEARRKRAGRMPALQRRKPKGDRADAQIVSLVLVSVLTLDFLFSFIS